MFYVKNCVGCTLAIVKSKQACTVRPGRLLTVRPNESHMAAGTELTRQQISYWRD
jgi:hypothetical protein